jgi:hypothetical protein
MTCKMALIGETDMVCNFADGELARGSEVPSLFLPWPRRRAWPISRRSGKAKGVWRRMSRVILKNEMGESNIRLQAGDMDRCPTRRQ